MPGQPLTRFRKLCTLCGELGTALDTLQRVGHVNWLHRTVGYAGPLPKPGTAKRELLEAAYSLLWARSSLKVAVNAMANQHPALKAELPPEMVIADDEDDDEGLDG